MKQNLQGLRVLTFPGIQRSKGSKPLERLGGYFCLDVPQLTFPGS